ncbi:UBX domain-containing protein 1-like [Mizuhopecten yessoensis]|uniref:UBX domain-containing protein 1 n=1 Tax=Mizuhopecten yessoensis TaxID=6573 RepID=A0A210QCZ5_MIZYE|nr:UBX domain-containing protein 1-like [Mizuhopecten yessoensis]OWF46591.1 UBX domain-containing protein 1 [Mizuhopecten yessoensis]
MASTADVQTLMEMGFTKNNAERALAKTSYQGVQLAMDWLFAHEDDPDINEPFEAPKGNVLGASIVDTPQTDSVGEVNLGGGGEPGVSGETGEAPSQAKSLKCDECGKLLKGEMDAQAHAARTQHSQFSESTDEIKPLTAEEKAEQMRKLQEKIKMNRLEREEKEKQEALAREIQRRQSGKMIVNTKQKFEEAEIKKLAEQRQREKRDDMEARRKVKEAIERDKAERAAKKNKPDVSQTADPQPKPAAPVEKKSYTDCQLQIRLPGGDTINHTFSAKESLAAVRLYIQMNKPEFGAFNLRQNFPPKVYQPEDYEKPLDQLGLVPRANLLVVKK